MDIPFIERKVRKQILFEEKETRDDLGKYYFIARGKAKSILQIYKALNVEFNNKLIIIIHILQHF